MAIPLRQSILATIAYADIFDYPLTAEEIRLWLVLRKAGKSGIYTKLTGLTGNRIKRNRYYFLSGRRRITDLRMNHAIQTVRKLKKAISICRRFRLIPTVRLVGVTGGLALENADTTDDIDLIFIVKSGTVWISRLAAILLTEMFARRRRAGDRDVADKICLNMFMTDGSLTMPADERDLYLAHEVLQMKPVWSRGDVYLRYLSANLWAKRYLPVAYEEKYHGASYLRNHGIRYKEKENRLIRSLMYNISTIMRLFEPLARSIQIAYMKKRRTSEVVTDSLIRFHPHDSRLWVAVEYRKRLRRLNIPLTKIWAGV